MKLVSEPPPSGALNGARESLGTAQDASHEVLQQAMPDLIPAPTTLGRPMFLVGERERRLYPLEPHQIDYIESAGNYVKYHVTTVNYIARQSIKELETVLAHAGFLRIERSILLNIRAIEFAQPARRGTFAFTLTSGTRLHSGPAYRDAILETLPLRRRG
jgi:two-component system LytT family response regulator